MESFETSNPSGEAMQRQAVVWLARRDRGLTPQEQDEFFQWLAADPRHGEFLARHQRTLASLKLLAQWRPEHGAQPNPDLLAQPRRRRFAWRFPIALAAAAALAAGIYFWRSHLGDSSAIALAPAFEQRLLEDGTMVELNRGAALVTDFRPHERRVLLVAGEAHFAVAKNPQRPFIVQAGQVRVRAVGTAFDVRLGARDVAVLVTEGRVQVGSDRASGPFSARLSTPPPPAAPVTVAAGERTVVSLGDSSTPPHVDQVSSDEIDRLLSWQPRELDFESTPLSQVVAEFNRHNRVQLVIGDPTISHLPIGANFRSDNIEGFVRLLEAGFGVKAERRGAEILLGRSK